MCTTSMTWLRWSDGKKKQIYYTTAVNNIRCVLWDGRVYNVALQYNSIFFFIQLRIFATGSTPFLDIYDATDGGFFVSREVVKDIKKHVLSYAFVSYYYYVSDSSGFRGPTNAERFEFVDFARPSSARRKIQIFRFELVLA